MGADEGIVHFINEETSVARVALILDNANELSFRQGISV